MLSGKEISDLLRTLQGHFYRLTGIALARRIETYKHDPAAGSEQDITEPLTARVQKLASEKKPVVTEAAPDATTVRPPAGKRDGNSHSPEAAARREVINKTLNGLSRHFQQTRPSTTLQPELGKKLQRSTWEHIHSAFRLARQGDIKTAMFHADLANTALKEAAMFVPQAEYSAFVADVEKRLEILGDEQN